MNQEYYERVSSKTEELEELCAFYDVLNDIKKGIGDECKSNGIRIDSLIATKQFEISYLDFLESIAELIVSPDDKEKK